MRTPAAGRAHGLLDRARELGDVDARAIARALVDTGDVRDYCHALRLAQSDDEAEAS